MEPVGTLLKIARIKSGLNQEEVIARLLKMGISLTQVSLSRYENDRREVGTDLLKALSIIYGIPVQDLIWSREEIQLYGIKRGE
jgi:transcriptional regulator with XRE-family HTH domain